MTEWIDSRLGDCCSFRAGDAFKRDEQGGSKGDYPFIKVSDMNLPGNSTRICEAKNWVTDEQVARLRLRAFPAGTTVFAKIGEALKQNRVRRLTQPTVIDNNMMAATAREDVVNPRFLFHLIRSVDLARFAVGTAVPYLTVKTLNSVAVSVPPISTQSAIARVLSTYDELIENNMRRIRIVEEMAQAVYREWFVEFRYPGHEDVPLVDSDLGPIPEGWNAGTLNDLLLLQRGFDLPKQSRRDGEVPVVAATGQNGFHDIARVAGPGVVTGRSGSLGTVIYVDEDFWPLNTTLWVKDFRRATPEVAYFVLRSLDLAQFNSGAAVPTLNRNDVSGQPLPIPPDDLVVQFSDFARRLLELKEILDRSNEKLRAMRDLVLPRLISGEIDVAGLEVPEVA